MAYSTNKPLYAQIANYIKEKIEKKELLPEQKLPTEVELANMFNVSRITSKKALEELEKDNLIYRIQGSGSYVSPEPEVKTDNRYYRTKVIAIILPFEGSNGRLIDSIMGAAEVVAEKGYYLTIHSANRSTDKERELLKSLFESKIEGIIYYPICDNRNLDILNMLNMYKYPVVTIDKYYESIPISYVVSDNLKGSYEAVSHLIKSGHTKIAYISDVDIESATSVRKRYFGYCQALIDNGIRLQEEIIKLDFKEAGNNELDEIVGIGLLEETVLKLLELGVTAIHTVNDYLAMNIVSACRCLDINVPKQLSIIGFDDLEASQFNSVPLTTVRQDFYEIGKSAAQILIEDIENKGHEYIQKIVPVKLIERASCIEVEQLKKHTG